MAALDLPQLIVMSQSFVLFAYVSWDFLSIFLVPPLSYGALSYFIFLCKTEFTCSKTCCCV